MRDIVLILHDIRSCHNVGSLLRTAEGIGVKTVYFTGYTPYPSLPNDQRLPYIHEKLTKQIHKTALGAEELQAWEARASIDELLQELTSDGFTLCALEQAETATTLHEFTPPNKVAVLLGREVEGIEDRLLKQVNIILEIPMYGRKESFNVVQAAAMTLHHLRFAD